ncbi:hypothetical protein J4E80_005674 [Alternaria sp. BMP 0032]|nr:hypothetical protein J4E80_005674 [Alternaria sp. BMP 0032]
MRKDNELVRIEIPTGYVEVCSLLKAIERSIRHRYLMPFVSMDTSYYTVPKEGHPAPEESSADQVELDSSNFSADEISTFSIPSLASAANDVSKGSGSSAEKIDAATWELRSIFGDDEILRPLYTTAIPGAIGPQAFVNAFERLLIEFARRLKDETQDRFGFLAARLVVWEAREISEEVLKRCQLATAQDTRNDSGYYSDGSYSSNEDEQGESNKDESSLEELTNMREFLVTRTAFKLLKEDMKTLISSKRQPKESSSEKENEMDSEEGTSRSNILLKSIIQTDAQAGPTESIILANYRGMFDEDQCTLDIYLYAWARLGKDRFIIEYSELLRHHHSNAHAAPDSEVDRSIGGSINEQLMTTWQRIASAIAQYLEDVDTILPYKWDEKCGANADKSTLLDPLSSGVKNCRDPAPCYHLNSEIALLALRGPLRQLFSHIPKRAMELSLANDTSFSFVNRTKAFLEDYTMVEWDWWPLSPRVPLVSHIECRLQWKVRFLFFMII